METRCVYCAVGNGWRTFSLSGASSSSGSGRVGFVLDKVALAKSFFPSTSLSPANLHLTSCSTITVIYHLGQVVAAVPSHPTKDDKT
jgi:hypothetical protein